MDLVMMLLYWWRQITAAAASSNTSMATLDEICHPLTCRYINLNVASQYALRILLKIASHEENIINLLSVDVRYQWILSYGANLVRLLSSNFVCFAICMFHSQSLRMQNNKP